MMEVILKIRMPDNWVKDITKKFPTQIKFLECMPYGDSGGRGLIEMEDKEEGMNEIIEEIKKHPDVCRVDISPLKNGGVLVIPVGGMYLYQTLVRVRKKDGQILEENLGGVAFVPLTGRYGQRL